MPTACVPMEVAHQKNMSHTYLVVVYFVFVVYRDRIAVAHLHLS